MSQSRLAPLVVSLGLLALGVPLAVSAADQAAATYRGSSRAIQFDVSPPLRDIPPIEPIPGLSLQIRREGMKDEDLAKPLGPQSIDLLVQDWIGSGEIPAPSVSFDGPSNVSNVSPPDPVGDVGPSHYVAMSNLSFAVYSKAGALLYGPALNNTLWSGFGGPCQNENAGDPIVLYDQLADRWLLTQFTAAGPTYYNCVALSTTNDPTGSYYRWAFSTGSNFPDYPKYGVWPDAYYISTREFAGSSFAGIGAYAINRAQMIAGNPAAQVVSFLASPAAAGGAFNVGDGLLPTDLEGFTLPPVGAPNYYIGSMDDGGPYSAPQDALTLWKFTVDFTTPANSSFVLANTLPVGSFDSVAAFCSGRSCVPQPGTTNKIDHLGYRQRPMHRASYRNLGTHESIVTNQSVEASATMSGIRWWEIRSPNASPVVFQEGTFAPGTADGVHRWMGSIATDGAGNMALGYSVSDGTSVYPGLRYTGRLSADTLGTMPQGEGTMFAGTGSQTGSQRWGDYSSMNVDPIDDCTFWYVNQYLPTTSSVGWRLRIGAFKFDECGTPDFYLAAVPLDQTICAGADATVTVNVGSVSGFNNAVTLAATGNPAPTTAGFVPNPVTPPGSSTLTIGNTATVAAGTYPINIAGTATASPGHNTNVNVTVNTSAPATATLTAPVNGALNVPATPTFTWSAVTQAATYGIQVATDAGFSNVVASASGLTSPTWTSNVALNTSTLHYWRVQATNACGIGVYSGVFSFTTVGAPGDCGPGTTANVLYQYGYEAGANGWTSGGTGNTWAIATTNPHAGTSHFHATDPATVSDQRLISPAVVLPTGENPVVLKFWHLPNLEPSGATACYDGGILEVSTDAGVTWTQVPAADILVGGYRTGTVSASFSNPLAGLRAWCGTTTYLNSVADLSAYAGQTVQLRLRLGSDNSTTGPGWDVDDVMVQSCSTSAIFSSGFEIGTLGEWDDFEP